MAKKNKAESSLNKKRVLNVGQDLLNWQVSNIS